MDPVRPSDNLMTGLLNRACGSSGGSTRSLCSRIDQMVHSNVIGDVFFAYQHDLANSANRVTRNHNLVAYIADLNKIILYDLVARHKVWDCPCPFPFRPSHGVFIDQLTLTTEGIVLVATKLFNYSINRKRNCHIFFEGEHTGTFEIDASAYTLEVVNANIYVLMLKKYQTATFCKWDIQGNKLSEILLDEFSEVSSLSLTEGDFYLVATGIASLRLDIPIKVFVYDLITSKTKIFDLELPKYPCQILSTKIHRHTAVFGITYHQTGYVSSKIVEMNVLTGKIEVEHQLECMSEVEKLIVSDEHIAFILQEGSDVRFLRVIDRRNGNQKKILAIPFCRDRTNIQMSICGQFLHVCYSDRDALSNIHCVFDLLISKIVKKVSYKHYAFNNISFQDGKLVIINNFIGTKDCLYVEDFIQVDGNREQEAVEPEMWERERLNVDERGWY